MTTFRAYADRLMARRLATLSQHLRTCLMRQCLVCRFTSYGAARGWTTDPIPHICGTWRGGDH